MSSLYTVYKLTNSQPDQTKIQPIQYNQYKNAAMKLKIKTN